MKKLFVIAALSLMVSCGSFRKTTEKSSEIKSTYNKELVADSTKNTQINKEIKNAVGIIATKSDLSDAELNKIIDRKVDEILAKMNMSGKSGDNSYQIIYDQLKRELQFQFKVGETKNESQVVTKSEKTEKSFEQNTDEYISKKVSRIPWWAYAIAVFWLLPQIIDRVNLFINPLASLKSKFTSK